MSEVVQALYTPIAADLPALYRRDPDSWDQITLYLELMDECLRQYLNALIELPAFLSPLATDTTPPCIEPWASLDDVARVQDARGLDQVCRWLGCDLPPDLRAPDAGLKARALQHWLRRKAHFLRRWPYLARTRHTPVGFLEYFCHWFDRWGEPTQSGFAPPPEKLCPVLLEHYRYRPEDGPDVDDPFFAWQATLFIPQSDTLQGVAGAEAVQRFVDANAPAHLVLRYAILPQPYWDTFRENVLLLNDLRAIFADVQAHLPATRLSARPESGGRR